MFSCVTLDIMQISIYLQEKIKCYIYVCDIKIMKQNFSERRVLCFSRLCVCMCVCVYIYIYTHTYIYIMLCELASKDTL